MTVRPPTARRPLRIVLLTEFFPPLRGGVENHVDALASRLARSGHEVHVVTLTEHPRPTNGAVVVHPLRAPVLRHLPHADAHRPYHPPLPVPRLASELRPLLASLQPDVVHAHNWAVASLPGDLSVPLVLTVHDGAFLCPKRTLYRRDESVCPGASWPRCIPCSSRHFGAVQATLLAPATAVGRRRLRPDGVIAVSKAIGDLVCGRLGWPYTTIPNFLPDDVCVASGDTPPLPARPFVMFAGDPGAHKGIDVLLDVWRRGDRPAAGLLLAVTREPALPVPAGVRVLALSRPQVAAALREASVVVVPSRWPEPAASVVLEAMVAGTPVVASRVGGLPEMVVEGETGLLVEPGDRQALGDAIRRLLGDRRLAERMGVASSARAQGYLAAVVVPRVEEVYREAIRRQCQRQRRARRAPTPGPGSDG